MLLALLRNDGYHVIDGGILPDSVERLSAAFQDALSKADLIVTSGGVSMGKEREEA